MTIEVIYGRDPGDESPYDAADALKVLNVSGQPGLGFPNIGKLMEEAREKAAKAANDASKRPSSNPSVARGKIIDKKKRIARAGM